MKNKADERLNLLKALSYNQDGKLPKIILIQLFKSLIRSVLEYSCFPFPASCNKGLMDKMEILQNHSLRIIIKKRQIDHIPIESLRLEAKVATIEKRLQTLLLRYFEKAQSTNNPLIKELINDYWIDFQRKIS